MTDARIATHRDPSVETVIARIGEWRGRSVTYQPVAGGITNTNWRVSVSGIGTDFFIKIPGKNTNLYIDRDAANDASRKAEASGYGPKVFHYFPDLGVEVLEFLDGVRSATNADFQRPTVRLNAVRALRSFNQQQPLSLTKTIFDMADDHFRLIDELGAYSPPDIWWLKEQMRVARMAVEASGMDLVPCMNDTLAANFMLTEDDDIRLVDFEYASNNDVHSELAVWLGEMFFPPSIEVDMLEEYFGRVSPQSVARLQVFKAMADLKWAAWAITQAQISSVDFDYHKYGVWKYLRARTVINDPRWNDWVREA